VPNAASVRSTTCGKHAAKVQRPRLGGAIDQTEAHRDQPTSEARRRLAAQDIETVMNDICKPISGLPDGGTAPGKELSPAARRALEEAALRRKQIDARAAEIAGTKEHQGRGGLEPVRYEDWEVKGLATDF
jgi:hypothetical protein